MDGKLSTFLTIIGESMVEQREKRKRRRKRKQGKVSIVSNVVLLIAIAVFLFSAYKIYTIYSEYNKGDTEYKSIVDEVITIETPEETEETEAEVKEVFKVDFEKLRSINKEVVAWLRFDKPEKINYPVCQGEDNDKYLKTTVEGKRNAAGAIFVDANNAGDFSDRNTFLYGHNMKNGSMFGQLRKYKNADYCKENPYFYIYTPDGKEVKYQIFAVCIVEDTAESYKKVYANDEEYVKYLEHIQSISRYDADVELSAQSQIVSLSTCTNVTETQRLLVHGVKISEIIIGE